MKTIMTVNGAIAPEKLGFCQSHEHLMIKKGFPASVFSHQQIDDIEKSTAELIEYYEHGGRSVVDAQPLGACRDTENLLEISKKSRVQIIASTGFHKMIFYPENHWIKTINSDELTEIYINELTNGMYIDGDLHKPEKQINACAGQIKTAIDSGKISYIYEKLFTAAADAAIESGSPIMVHIETDSNPVYLAEFFEKKNLDLNKIVFCHMDRSIPDLNIHKELCKRGVYMEYDTIARNKYHSDEKEIEIISEMIESGFENQILMSLDITRDRIKNYGGRPGLSYILDNFINNLNSNGINKNLTDKFFIHNPAKFFSK